MPYSFDGNTALLEVIFENWPVIAEPTWQTELSFAIVDDDGIAAIITGRQLVLFFACCIDFHNIFEIDRMFAEVELMECNPISMDFNPVKEVSWIMSYAKI